MMNNINTALRNFVSLKEHFITSGNDRVETFISILQLGLVFIPFCLGGYFYISYFVEQFKITSFYMEALLVSSYILMFSLIFYSLTKKDYVLDFFSYIGISMEMFFLKYFSLYGNFRHREIYSIHQVMTYFMAFKDWKIQHQELFKYMMHSSQDIQASYQEYVNKYIIYDLYAFVQSYHYYQQSLQQKKYDLAFIYFLEMESFKISSHFDNYLDNLSSLYNSHQLTDKLTKSLSNNHERLNIRHKI